MVILLIKRRLQVWVKPAIRGLLSARVGVAVVDGVNIRPKDDTSNGGLVGIKKFNEVITLPVAVCRYCYGRSAATCEQDVECSHIH
jgi:hypothetical protein